MIEIVADYIALVVRMRSGYIHVVQLGIQRQDAEFGASRSQRQVAAGRTGGLDRRRMSVTGKVERANRVGVIRVELLIVFVYNEIRI